MLGQEPDRQVWIDIAIVVAGLAQFGCRFRMHTYA